MSVATQAVAFDISKAFDRVLHAGLLHKLKHYGTSGQIFDLISSFLSNRQLQAVLEGKLSKGYPLNAGFPQVSILGPNFFIQKQIRYNLSFHFSFCVLIFTFNMHV